MGRLVSLRGMAHPLVAISGARRLRQIPHSLQIMGLGPCWVAVMARHGHILPLSSSTPPPLASAPVCMGHRCVRSAAPYAPGDALVMAKSLTQCPQGLLTSHADLGARLPLPPCPPSYSMPGGLAHLACPAATTICCSMPSCCYHLPRHVQPIWF